MWSKVGPSQYSFLCPSFLKKTSYPQVSGLRTRKRELVPDFASVAVCGHGQSCQFLYLSFLSVAWVQRSLLHLCPAC